jgi:tetratricopeptide (TPR) repeat protein
MLQPTSSQFSGIFICYRREDTSGHAGRLFDRLVSHFGKDTVFMDIDTIEPGEDFVSVIENAVGSCDILIAIIGKHWLSRAGETSRFLDNPNDFVRLEVATALARDIRVIPVLVQGAVMPKPKDLPDDMSQFSRRNAVELGDVHWQRDVDQLIIFLERVLATLHANADCVSDERTNRVHDTDIEQSRRKNTNTPDRATGEQRNAHKDMGQSERPYSPAVKVPLGRFHPRLFSGILSVAIIALIITAWFAARGVRSKPPAQNQEQPEQRDSKPPPATPSPTPIAPNRNLTRRQLAEVEQAISLGNTHRDAKDYVQAEKEYRRALLINPFESRALNGLGNVLYDRGLYEEASAQFKSAIEVDPTNSASHYSLGLAYLNSNNKSAALEQYTALVNLKSTYANALLQEINKH